MRYYSLKIILFISIILYCTNHSYSDNDKKVTVTELIHSSEKSIKKIFSNPEFDNLKDYLDNSRAILIFPELYEGGLIFGAKGGNGIMIIRRSENEFSGPFFIQLAV